MSRPRVVVRDMQNRVAEGKRGAQSSEERSETRKSMKLNKTNNVSLRGEEKNDMRKQNSRSPHKAKEEAYWDAISSSYRSIIDFYI